MKDFCYEISFTWLDNDLEAIIDSTVDHFASCADLFVYCIRQGDALKIREKTEAKKKTGQVQKRK